MGEIDIKEVMRELSENVLDTKLKTGDFSDLGNEIGIIIGNMFTSQPMTREEIEDFVAGFEHGVSLTNGTHP
jgi:hypothetical protein